MKLYQIFLMSLLFFFLNCEKKKDKNSLGTRRTIQLNSNVKGADSLKSNEIISIMPKPFTKDFLNIKNADINDHQIILSHQNFDKIYPTKDSVITDVWECGSPFEWLDEVWMVKTYGKRSSDSGTFEKFDGEIMSIYTNKAEFNSNKHIILFGSGDAHKNSFQIKSHHIVLNHNTTIEEFQNLFPKLEKEITDEKNVTRFRIPINKDSDDAFLFYFRNGKLDEFLLWWLLC